MPGTTPPTQFTVFCPCHKNNTDSGTENVTRDLVLKSYGDAGATRQTCEELPLANHSVALLSSSDDGMLLRSTDSLPRFQSSFMFRLVSGSGAGPLSQLSSTPSSLFSHAHLERSAASGTFSCIRNVLLHQERSPASGTISCIRNILLHQERPRAILENLYSG
ncbi:hypothetical protein EYF80_044150 [Liparis tanakae]|uniref:Uncharacterized protein n=1 Tax=Liparis tanakae TaxID=230148 RepID=A0A4Z2FZ85_9TELE|nr:hypothetical protein EYF80_044150 [Liparis tanakae]